MFANHISSRKVSISGVSSIRFATEGILLASEHMGRIFIIKCQHHQPLEKCNPKAMRDATAWLLEGLHNMGTHRLNWYQMLGSMRNNRATHTLWVSIKNSTLENWQFLWNQTCHCHPIWCTPGYPAHKRKSLCYAQICTWISTTILLVTAENWKQPDILQWANALTTYYRTILTCKKI